MLRTPNDAWRLSALCGLGIRDLGPRFVSAASSELPKFFGPRASFWRMLRTEVRGGGFPSKMPFFASPFGGDFSRGGPNIQALAMGKGSFFHFCLTLFSLSHCFELGGMFFSSFPVCCMVERGGGRVARSAGLYLHECHHPDYEAPPVPQRFQRPQPVDSEAANWNLRGGPLRPFGLVG